MTSSVDVRPNTHANPEIVPASSAVVLDWSWYYPGGTLAIAFTRLWTA
jgi:hypothetical protein